MSFQKKPKEKGRSRRKRSKFQLLKEKFSSFTGKFKKKKPKGRSRKKRKNRLFARSKYVISSLLLLVSQPPTSVFASENVFEYETSSVSMDDAMSMEKTDDTSKEQSQVGLGNESPVLISIYSDPEVENVVTPIGPGYVNSNHAETLDEESNLSMADYTDDSLDIDHVSYKVDSSYATCSDMAMEEFETLDNVLDTVTTSQKVGPAYVLSSTVIDKEKKVENIVLPIGPGYVTPSNAMRSEDMAMEEFETLDDVLDSVVTPQKIGPGYVTSNDTVTIEDDFESLEDISYMKETVMSYCQFDEVDYQMFCNQVIQNLREKGIQEADEQLVIKMLYRLSQTSTEEKVASILSRYNITAQELQYTVAGCIAEGKGGSYIDVFGAANIVGNRDKDAAFRSSYGDTIYAQMIGKNQFAVTVDGRLLLFIEDTQSNCYHAAIDYFYSEIPLLKLLSFRGSGTNYSDFQLTSRGNRYGGREVNSELSPFVLEFVDYQEEVDYTRNLVP